MADRRIYARRLALAAAVSMLAHVLLWGGLATTRLGLLGSQPQDATTPIPSSTPQVAVDFPLVMPQSRSEKLAHERPLDVPVEPLPPTREQSQDPRQERAMQPLPEESTAVAVASQPQLQRPATPSEIAAAQAAALQRQQPMAATEAAVAADTTGLTPAAAGQQQAVPRPTTLPRPTESAAVGVASRRPREVAVVPSTTPMPPAEIERRSADTPAGAAKMLAMPAPAPQRPPTTAAAAPDAIANRVTAPAAAETAQPAAAPRPQARSGGLPLLATRADRGQRTMQPSQTAPPDTAGDSPTGRSNAISAGREMSLSGSRAGSDRNAESGTSDGLQAGSPGPVSAAAAASLPRSNAAAGGPLPDTRVAAVAPPMAIASAGAPVSGGLAGPVEMMGLGARAASGVRPGLSARPGASPTMAGVETDLEGDEGLSSSASEGIDSRIAGGLSGAMSGGRREESTSGPSGTAATAPRAAPTLGRVAAVVLPAEGRVREIASPFARRSRATRDAAARAVPESVRAIRQQTRADADALIERGLDFLARSQQPDGRWRLGEFPGATAADTPKLSCDTAATGLAILSFLGAGYDHFGGKHQDTVRRGLEFLLAVQKPDGDLYLPADPLSDSCAWLYSHGIATMALCEAVGMTGDPLVKPAAARACGFIASSQHPDRGGWRYTPRSDADLSVSGWMLVALRSGRLAGVEVEPRTFDGVRALLDGSTVAGDPARYLYNSRSPQQRPSQLSSGCMTAVGTLMRLHTDWSAADPRVQQSARLLASFKPSYGTATQKTRDCYLWYYASQVLVHTGGEDWSDWYDALADTLEHAQERQGPRAGSWDPLGETPDRWGVYGGRIYVTALHLLTLEVPDRRLPTYDSVK